MDKKNIILTRKFSFDAAHKLPFYEGNCRNLHGHTYFLEVTVSGDINNKTGMIIDFKVLKKIVNKNVLDTLDHSCINDIVKNPTAENLINWIWDSLEPIMRDYKIKLHELRLWEKPELSITRRLE